MKQHILNKFKIMLTTSLILCFYSTSLFSFSTILQEIFSKNQSIIELEKKLSIENSKEANSPLEMALKGKFNQKKNLEKSRFEIKNIITLNTIKLYFEVLKNTENERTIANFFTYTGVKFKQTNLYENIDKFIIPRTDEKAYSQFLLQSDIKIEAILHLFNTTKPSIRKLIKQHYLQMLQFSNIHYNLIKKIEKIKDKKQAISLKKEIINAKYNILLEKCKILLITGNLLSNFDIQKEKKQIFNIKLNRIHFMPNTTTITSYSSKILEKNAKKIKNIDNYTLELHSYTDNIGNKKSNNIVSKNRLHTVKNAMIQLGIKEKNIKTFSHGNMNPIATNKTKKGRLLNRRVEFKVIKNEI